MTSSELAGQVALVTGAGSGIGRAITNTLSEAGAAVVCGDLRPERAGETAASIREAGGQASEAELDVTREDSIEETVAEIIRRFGRLDVLVNNAGISTRTQPLHETSLQDWNRVLAVNLTGVFLCTRAALRPMLAHRTGVIVNIASILGLVSAPPDLWRFANYSASKGGVIALTRATAAEYGPEGIRANAIAPGWIAGTRLGEEDRPPDPNVEKIHVQPAVAAVAVAFSGCDRTRRPDGAPVPDGAGFVQEIGKRRCRLPFSVEPDPYGGRGWPILKRVLRAARFDPARTPFPIRPVSRSCESCLASSSLSWVSR